MTSNPQISTSDLETSISAHHQNSRSLHDSGHKHGLLPLLTVILFFVGASAFGQVVPVINDVTPLDTYPNNVGFPTVPSQLLITGAGFSNTPGDLQVWFGQVAGEIVSSSDFAIEVKVPPQARLSNVTVVNTASKLSASSVLKFVPTYSGSDFEPARLASPVSFSATPAMEIFDACACDLNLDGKPDIIGTSNNPNASTLAVLKNIATPGTLSTGSFDPPASIILGFPTFNVACGDLNGDGKPDLVASRGGSNRNEIVVRVNNNSGGTVTNFTTVPNLAGQNLFLDQGHNAFRIVIRDMNMDGKADIVASNSAQTTGTTFNVIYVFKNTSSGGVTSIDPVPTKITVTDALSSYGIDAQDLDGDELPDIVLNQFNGNTFFTLKNTSTISQISFAPAVKHVLPGDPQLVELSTGDYNEDGKLDVVITDAFGDKAFVLINNTTSAIQFLTPIQLTTGDFPYGVESADVDGDGDVDILVGNRGFGTTALNLFKNNGDNNNLAFTAVTINTGKKSRNVRVSDIDGDGKPDISYTTDGPFSGACLSGECSWDIIRNENCFVPQVINDLPLTVCPGQTIELKSIPGIGVTDYSWSKDGGAGASSGLNPFADVTGPGVYTVTATSESTCSKISSTFTVSSGAGTLPAAPTITSSNPTFVCVGANLQLNAAAEAGATYAWEGPNGFTSTQQNPSLPAVSSDNAGFYSLKLSNGTCFTEAAEVRVDIASLVSFAVTSTVPSNQLCLGSTLNLSTNQVPLHSYQWIKDGVDIGGATNSTLNAVNSQGAYQVRVKDNTYLCEETTAPAVDVIVLTLPVAAFTVQATACLGEDVSFTNTSQFDARATVTYAWAFGDATSSDLENPVHAYNTALLFNPSVTVAYTGVPGCSDVQANPVSVVNPVQPVIVVTPAGATELCPGETATLTITGTYASITWDPTAATTPSIDVTVADTYTVNTVDANGCAGQDDETITVKTLPDLTVTASDTVVNIGRSTNLTASSTTVGSITYLWTPPDFLDNPNVPNPVSTPDTTVVYTVAAALDGGCTATQIIRIRVTLDHLDVPNVFTPNGDTFNDYWVIPGVESFPDCTIALYDKQGRRIFERIGYQNDPGWDGMFDGRSVPPGTYYFVFACPDKEPQTGHVLVAR